jgi:hypothetical protein
LVYVIVTFFPAVNSLEKRQSEKQPIKAEKKITYWNQLGSAWQFTVENKLCG